MHTVRIGVPPIFACIDGQIYLVAPLNVVSLVQNRLGNV